MLCHTRPAQDVDDLTDLMQTINELVNSQGEMTDSILDNVERTQVEVQAGQRDLQRAVRSKQAKYPLVAALVGSLAAGGPVGVAAGSAVAGVAAAVGGAVAGLYGGRLMKQKTDAENR